MKKAEDVHLSPSVSTRSAVIFMRTPGATPLTITLNGALIGPSGGDTVSTGDWESGADDRQAPALAASMVIKANLAQVTSGPQKKGVSKQR
jgi:hypothetical protein